MPYDCKMYSIIQFFLLQESFIKTIHKHTESPKNWNMGILQNLTSFITGMVRDFFFLHIAATGSRLPQ